MWAEQFNRITVSSVSIHRRQLNDRPSSSRHFGATTTRYIRASRRLTNGDGIRIGSQVPPGQPRWLLRPGRLSMRQQHEHSGGDAACEERRVRAARAAARLGRKQICSPGRRAGGIDDGSLRRPLTSDRRQFSPVKTVTVTAKLHW